MRLSTTLPRVASRSIAALLLLLFTPCLTSHVKAQNPYLPLWEYIPDGEPYVFEDPDKPGEYRVYIYGSHDSLIKEYCGREQVVWSASVNNLSEWRYDGVIFKSVLGPDGRPLDAELKADVLYAPDVTMKIGPDGKKEYYLYPNNQAGGRNGMVAKSDRPDGPFKVINWSKTNPTRTDGVLEFDPAVFVDDDGRVYGYWGFEKSYCAEFDPATMATVKPGTEIIKDMISGRYDDGIFSFFEASSMRKIEDKYVFIYSRFTKDGEKGLPASNYTLAYAYSDNPMGPFTYGGTIIDGRAIATDANGKSAPTAHPDGNTHGSICQINGQWYVFYHRQCGLDEYSRQAMVAPITVRVEKGKGGKVFISEGEYTSEGFMTEGLNPLHRTAAGWACYYTGPKPATHDWPNNTFFGSYIHPTRIAGGEEQTAYTLKEPICPVINNTAGSTVGFKYFNINKLNKKQNYALAINLKPQGVDGTVKVLLGAPSEKDGASLIGTFSLNANMPQRTTTIDVPLHGWQNLKGKQALYFVFESATPDKSLCELYDFIIR